MKEAFIVTDKKNSHLQYAAELQQNGYYKLMPFIDNKYKNKTAKQVVETLLKCEPEAPIIMNRLCLKNNYRVKNNLFLSTTEPAKNLNLNN